jgi:hypothetical protein
MSCVDALRRSFYTTLHGRLEIALDRPSDWLREQNFAYYSIAGLDSSRDEFVKWQVI